MAFTGSELDPVGLVPIYSDFLREQVCSAPSLSVWQHIHWSLGHTLPVAWTKNIKEKEQRETANSKNNKNNNNM